MTGMNGKNRHREKKKRLFQKPLFSSVQDQKVLYKVTITKSEDRDVARLEALGTAFYIEFYFLTFFQCPETIALNGCVVNENIITFRLSQKPVTL